MASFADTAGAIAHQIEAPSCARPDELPTFAEAALAWGGLGPSWVGFEAIDVKVRPHRVDRSAGGEAIGGGFGRLHLAAGRRADSR